ncbi:MAG: peptidoglycan-binding protein [Alphaproteobacteria bacterium]|nr:peptidoglycan-binding protein [Alphaproteobacteria bacterium]
MSTAVETVGEGNLMPVLPRAQTVLFAAAVALTISASSASAEQLTMKKFERAWNDVVSGKIFDAAAKQVRQAHKKYLVDPAGKSATWPFYIPDRPNKPVQLGPKHGQSVANVQPKAKPLVVSPKVRNTQSALNTLGYDAGVADGVYGRKTAEAVERYQNTIGATVTGALTGEQREQLIKSAQQKRQLAAIQPKHQQTPSRAHTVVAKQPGVIVEPKTNKAAKQGQVVILNKPKVRPAPVDGAKTSLPQSSDANPFDADDPDDELTPAQ